MKIKSEETVPLKQTTEVLVSMPNESPIPASNINIATPTSSSNQNSSLVCANIRSSDGKVHSLELNKQDNTLNFTLQGYFAFLAQKLVLILHNNLVNVLNCMQLYVHAIFLPSYLIC